MSRLSDVERKTLRIIKNMTMFEKIPTLSILAVRVGRWENELVPVLRSLQELGHIEELRHKHYMYLPYPHWFKRALENANDPFELSYMPAQLQKVLR